MERLIQGVNQGIHRYVDQVQLNMKRRNDGLIQWEKRLTGEESVCWNQHLNVESEPSKGNYLSIPKDSTSTFSDTLVEVRRQSNLNYSKGNIEIKSGNIKKSEKAVIQAPVQAVTKHKNDALIEARLGRNMMTSINEGYSYPLSYGSPYVNRYINGLNGYYPFYTVTPSVDKLY